MADEGTFSRYISFEEDTVKKQIWATHAASLTANSVAVAIFLSGLLAMFPPMAHAQVVNSTLNPLQIATLHWDSANQVTTQFTVGTAPSGIAFDGASMWVANGASNTVNKLRASDGAMLGTFAVPAQPGGVAFDGANVWITNVQGGIVTKLRASDGAHLGTFSTGRGSTGPLGIAFDGANVWVAD